MSDVKVEKVSEDWIAVEYHGRTRFIATAAEARELYAKLGEVLGERKCEHDCDQCDADGWLDGPVMTPEEHEEWQRKMEKLGLLRWKP